MNFYEFKNKTIGKFWIAAESEKEALDIVMSGKFEVFDFNRFFGDSPLNTKEDLQNGTQQTQPVKCPVCENGTRYVPYGTPKGIPCKWCDGTGIQQAGA